MSEAARDRRPAVGTVVDEIGIEIGIFGDWRLKAQFVPIFAPTGNRLRAVAVRSSVRPFMFGRQVEDRVFRRAVPLRERLTVSALEAVLALRNIEHTYVPELKLVLGVDNGAVFSPARGAAAARALASEAERAGLAPADIFVEPPQSGDAAESSAVTARQALRSQGLGVALREAGEGIDPADDAGNLLVTIDGGWFRTVARQDSTAQLFGALVHGYHLSGATVWVEGIELADQLRVAIRAGVDWVSGPLIAPAALAGAVFPEEAQPLDALLDERRVIPLFR